MTATNYVILLSVLHILDYQLDAEKINSLARQPLYLTLIVQNSNSHLLFQYVSYRNSGEKMLKYQ